MRKISIAFFLAVFCTANVFAATSSISRAIPTKTTGEDNTQHVENVSVKNRSGANISRTVARKKNVENETRNTPKQNVVSRSVNTRKKNSGAGLSDAVNTVGRNARTEAASINSTAALRRAGIVLRASTAEVGGRATIGNSDVQTGSNIDEQVRGVRGRAALFGSNRQQQNVVTAESLANAKDIMEKTNDLNNVCQQQYNECMDQFCAVVDANQKRCSCSANLAKYAKSQKAVEEANTELNEVAQRIRYVGLSADEIRAIMSATEAELEMDKTKDNTKNRSMLDDIADMIKDPTASTTLTTSTNDSILDLDFDFSSDSSDLFSLDLFNNSSSDISSKRGTALYKEATKRCKTVLNQCKDAGGTESQITGNYDLAIAKDCIAYEQGLEKLNQTLKNNVRSAGLMLQKARMAVLQDKNEYDAKECIGALEKCMLDDMVCGEDYLKCLDPTKRYIDENGTVVLGKNIANITAFMTEYNNSKIDSEFIKASASDTNCANQDGACIVNYLMQKIGTGATTKDGGLCRPVLDRCQYYTYDKNTKKSTYKPYNDVVVQYIQRAMVNIKAAQSRIISDYASSCLASVRDCYNQQNTQITALTSTVSVENVYRVMTGACYNVALTCGYAVFAYDAKVGGEMNRIATEYIYNCPTTNCCTNADATECNGTTQCCSTIDTDDLTNRINNLTNTQQSELYAKQAPVLIKAVSEMFYQSLLCPENSTYVDIDDNQIVNVTNRTIGGFVNDRCKCNAGYSVWNGSCMIKCDNNQYRNNSGTCTKCPTGQEASSSTSSTEGDTTSVTEHNTCIIIAEP